MYELADNNLPSMCEQLWSEHGRIVVGIMIMWVMGVSAWRLSDCSFIGVAVAVNVTALFLMFIQFLPVIPTFFMMLAFTSFVWLVISEIMAIRYELVEPDEMGEYHD